MIGVDRLLASFLVRRARAARQAGRYADAATLYGEAAALAPRRRAGLLIQCGHMLKEAGDLAGAERRYDAAQRLLPADAELALQRGHLFKLAGRLAESHAAYAEAARLRPGWDEAARELEGLRLGGWRGPRDGRLDPFEHEPPRDAPRPPEPEPFTPAELARLVPALAPRRPDELLVSHPEGIDIRRLGRREAGYWGNRRTLRGVEAIRGVCVSDVPIVELQLILNAIAIHRGPVRGGYPIACERDPDRRRKYVFNLWLDVSPFALGLHKIEVRLVDADGGTRSYHDEVVIAAAVPEADHPRSNALVSIDPADPRSVEAQVKARPSMVHPARRVLFPGGVRSVAVMRTDQLGDLVASIPAMRRLREIVPDARIVGLLTGANADLARTLGVFDEVVVVDFPDDPVERRRVMPLDAQDALRRRLEPYRFDVAIDLAQSNVSRDLLPLTGAAFLYGTGGGDWPWLDAEFQFNTHDRWNALDNTPHSAKVLALVEALGTLLRADPPIVHRADLGRDLLVPFGIGPDDRYVLLHAGARIAFSRWPGYAALAARILADTDLKVVLIAEHEAPATIPATLRDDPRFVLLTERLPFDRFDALISFATIVVGNDSGPKHLAALRGVDVVALFTARINWTEWGQESGGTIVSRRVPCAGCAILHDPEECGQDFTCIRDIAVDEVFDAMTALMRERASA